MTTGNPCPQRSESGTVPDADPPRHSAWTLIGPDRTARIVLDGTAYTLRITRAGKLILTK